MASTCSSVIPSLMRWQLALVMPGVDQSHKTTIAAKQRATTMRIRLRRLMTATKATRRSLLALSPLGDFCRRIAGQRTHSDPVVGHNGKVLGPIDAAF